MSNLIQVQDLNEHIRLINFNRPKAKNALTTEMYAELEQQLRQADAADNVRAIVLYGNAECFSAGNDISDFLASPPQDENSAVFSFLRAFNKLQTPVVAAVNGVAIGIGTTMLLHCDLVYASRSAIFSTPFVNLGCTPEGGSSLLFGESMGHRQAAELLLLGDKFGAEKAERVGLITAISSSDDAFDDALAAAKAIALKAPGAMQEAKRIMKSHKLEQIDQTIVTEARLFCARLNSPEAHEALNAFKEKRKPGFSGF